MLVDLIGCAVEHNLVWIGFDLELMKVPHLVNVWGYVDWIVVLCNGSFIAPQLLAMLGLCRLLPHSVSKKAFQGIQFTMLYVTPCTHARHTASRNTGVPIHTFNHFALFATPNNLFAVKTSRQDEYLRRGKSVQ